MKRIVAAAALAWALLSWGGAAFADDSPQYQMRLVVGGVVGDVMGYLPVADLRKMAKAYGKDAKTQAAEEDGRVVVDVLDTPYLLDAATKKYKCRFEVKWLDPDGVPFKIIRLENELTVGSEGPDQEHTVWKAVDEVYTPVAKVGFPIMVVVTVLLIAF